MKKQWSVVGGQWSESPRRRSSFIVPRSSFSGFTLVELLVVIAIIGTLMALLLPAVQSAKETARQNTCRNNMRNLAVAMRDYETSRRELPGYANGIAKVSNGNAVSMRLATWPMMVFPQLERTDIWSVWNDASTANTNLLAPYVEIFVCPSDGEKLSAGMGQKLPVLSYVANCGKTDVAPITQYKTAPPVTFAGDGSAAYLAAEKPANGMFFNRFDIPTKNSKFIQLVSSLDKIPDGASNTLMISENVAAFQYTYLNNTDMPKQFSTATSAECSTGFVWDAKNVASHVTPTDARKINGVNPGDKKFNYQIDQTNFGSTYSYYYARPSSYHTGGVNVAMCGGEVFFMRDDIDYWVYEQLMTPDGKHSDMPPGFGQTSNATDNINYVLQDSDYK